MSQERTHQIVYFETALPSVFHQSPEEFLFYLERDGNKFLQFYWEQVGKSFSASGRGDAYGLNYFVRKPDKNVSIVVVLLPSPREAGEAYYEAFVYRPRRITPILRISDMTAVFALTMTSENGEAARTAIVERTRKDQSIEHGAGTQPVVEDFYQAVLGLIRDSRGNIR
jgi:hypothetical protein